jgi:hypothetical protein
MTSELESIYPILVKYAHLYAKVYGEKWMPTSEHIGQTLTLLKSPVPGFDAYTPNDMTARLEVFFNTKEDWLVSCKHNYSVFIRHFHRWIPKKAMVIHRVSFDTTEPVCQDCGNPVERGGICLKCYPICQKCGKQHAVEDNCAEFAERMNRIQSMLSNSSQRSGKTKELRELL